MSQINSALRSGIDWVALATYLALVLIGWLMIYSSQAEVVDSAESFKLQSLIGKHFMFVVISLFLFVCTLFIDWKFWDTFSYVFYAIGIVSLIGVLIFGMELKGAQSWYSLFGFSFQPSETAKFFTCLALASFVSSYKTDLGNIRDQLTAIAMFVVPSFLIILQPDAGSSLVFFSFFIMLYREGLSPIYYVVGLSLVAIFILSLLFGPQTVTFLIIGIGLIILAFRYKSKMLWIALISAAILGVIIFVPKTEFLYVNIAALVGLMLMVFLQWDSKKLNNYILLFGLIGIAVIFAYGSNYAFETLLKSHQQVRINAWLRPHLCDQDDLYNIIQSKLAIGSGGLQGKGFLQGDMTKLDYVPEKSSDFIFSIIGEEQGFLGAVSVILLFILLLYRILVIAERAKSNFVRHYAYGVAGIIFIHYFINIGMVMGIMPVIGIPLPFLSQGGTALIAFSIMIGVLLRMDLSR